LSQKGGGEKKRGCSLGKGGKPSEELWQMGGSTNVKKGKDAKPVKNVCPTGKGKLGKKNEEHWETGEKEGKLRGKEPPSFLKKKRKKNRPQAEPRENR